MLNPTRKTNNFLQGYLWMLILKLVIIVEVGKLLATGMLLLTCYTYVIVITHQWGLYLRAECLQIRYKPNGCVKTVLFYDVWVDQKCP